MIVVMDRAQSLFTAESFVSEVRKRWPVSRIIINDRGAPGEDVGAQITPVGRPSFTIDHLPNNRVVTSDGGPFVSAEVAAWVREVHPDPDLALWLVDDMFNGHVVLHPGITTDEIHAGWVDHREHDPYEEFPQYFADWKTW